MRRVPGREIPHRRSRGAPATFRRAFEPAAASRCSGPSRRTRWHGQRAEPRSASTGEAAPPSSRSANTTTRPSSRHVRIAAPYSQIAPIFVRGPASEFPGHAGLGGAGPVGWRRVAGRSGVRTAGPAGRSVRSGLHLRWVRLGPARCFRRLPSLRPSYFCSASCWASGVSIVCGRRYPCLRAGPRLTAARRSSRVCSGPPVRRLAAVWAGWGRRRGPVDCPIDLSRAPSALAARAVA